MTCILLAHVAILIWSAVSAHNKTLLSYRYSCDGVKSLEACGVYKYLVMMRSDKNVNQKVFLHENIDVLVFIVVSFCGLRVATHENILP